MNGMCCEIMGSWAWLKVSGIGLAIFVTGLLVGMKLNSRRNGGSSHGGSNRPVRSPDLYIGNLTEDITGEELQKQFGKYGDVREVRMVPPRNGETKTFAFITMSSVEAAQSAMNGMNGKDVSGRKIVVSEARSRGSNGRRGPRR